MVWESDGGNRSISREDLEAELIVDDGIFGTVALESFSHRF